MVLFLYLERRGIYAIPRVLWGREDQALKKIREILQKANKLDPDETAKKMLEISNEINDLVFPRKQDPLSRCLDITERGRMDSYS